MYNFPIAYLNSNDGSSILAFGEGERISLKTTSDLFQELESFLTKWKGHYLIGAVGYDVKNVIEKLESNNQDNVNFPELFFWKPEYVIRQKNEHLEFVQGEKNSESLQFLDYFVEEETDSNFHPYTFDFKARTNKEDYLSNVNKLKNHIQQGDIYEVNYCQEFFAENVEINYPLDAYFKLNKLTKAPFSTFLTFDQFSLYCGSPERYIRKTGTKLISQPIKGTAKRGSSEKEDEILKAELQNDLKERSENVMIVDLVRNDLSKIAQKDSVTVDELFGIYTFKTVHQLISTVSCEVSKNTSFSDLLKATFPMGSMTGAPKIKAMQLIEEFEDFKRGMYSGTVGFIDPKGDFDFNVIIRSLIFNSKNNYLSCSVGGAITIRSDAESEYEECMTKIKGIIDGMNA